MEEFPKWFLRIMIVVGTIAFVSVYWMRHDWSKGWMPSFNTGDYSPPGAAPEPAVPATPAPSPAPAPAASVAGEAARPTAAPSVPAAAPAAARASVPCQPIGRTAKGELVYSMDCRALPAQ